MKKLFTTSILLASAAVMMAQAAGPNPLPEKLYMMEEVGISINTVLAPGADDQALTLNDGVYEGTVSLTKDRAFRFYVGTASDYQVLGPSRDTYTTQVSFSTYQNYEGDCYWYDTTAEKGNWTPVMEQGVSEIQVNMTVNPGEGTVVFEPIQPKEEAPDALYVWGSIDGGETFKAYATLEPTAENPYIFTVTFEVPKCGPFDGMGSGEAPGIYDKNEGFYFKLSEANTGGGNMYGYPASDDDPDGKYIELAEDGEPYVATLGRTQASNLVDLSPGLTTFTFDFENWNFTAELIEAYVEPAYYLWGSTDGGYKYTCVGEMVLNNDGVYELSVDVPKCGPFEDDPDAGFGPSNTFDSGYFMFVSTDGESVSNGTSYIAPENDCIIDFTETSQNFSVTLDQAGGADLHVLVATTPGKTIFTFDAETLTFTAELIEAYVEPAYYLWGSTDGGYKYTCVGEMVLNNDGVYELSVVVPECGPFEEDPDASFGPTNTFDSGYFMFVSTDGQSVSNGTSYIAPENDCIISFTETSQNFSVTLDQAGGADLHALVAMTPGKTIFTFDAETLDFTATFDDVITKVESLTKNEVVGPVYNLQGVKVADGNNLNGLNGLFIINGKKVIIK